MDTEYAFAKLTISLRIVGRRADGYHLLDAEMVSVDLRDRLDFAGGDRLTIEGMASEGMPSEGTPSLTAGPDNLVRKALAAVGRTAAVRLEKRIPVGAGLGGGSADAAAVLRWAGCSDLRLAASVGADVPFCLVGGRARVTGVGEVVTPLPFTPGQPYTLLSPPFGVSTAAVYRAWDELGGPSAVGPNDLEPAALAVEPRLGEWRDRLGDATGVAPVLAGSGSTWFVPGSFPEVDGAVVVQTARPVGVG